MAGTTASCFLVVLEKDSRLDLADRLVVPAAVGRDISAPNQRASSKDDSTATARRDCALCRVLQQRFMVETAERCCACAPADEACGYLVVIGSRPATEQSRPTCA